ncbi:MarR family winged helix-turn-helix transcriptional regulator [Wolinella succinogenes]|uniref:MarR family winged helix-turn-helix transcriptional regulator n=1 Tax=Wolinella succinogenes TaxID=844 RepID=UPI00240A53A5|nr:MarR family transcriptional regulator [Wolinella succinogenes]
MNTYLKNSPGFWIGRIHHKLKNRMNQRLKPYDLTAEQRLILLRLFEFGEMTQQQLCQKTFTEPSNITLTLRRMEGHGYVRKKPHPKDKRASLIEATPKALSIQKELERIGLEITDSLLLEVDPSEKETLLRVLQAMYQKMLQEEAIEEFSF